MGFNGFFAVPLVVVAFLLFVVVVLDALVIMSSMIIMYDGNSSFVRRGS